MMPRHHLDPATIVSYAAGAMSPELSAIVATHLGGCAMCRKAITSAEDIGGLLMEQQQPPPAARQPGHLRAQMLARLESGVPNVAEPAVRTVQDPDQLPWPLRPYFGNSYAALKWRWMGPGMHYLRAVGPTGGTLLMLRIGPGKSMPVHGHRGNEITQILSGAYDDALGHFAAGDVADLDSEIEHQPVTSPGEPCICVAALDAPLRFPGWMARMLQPAFGI